MCRSYREDAFVNPVRIERIMVIAGFGCCEVAFRYSTGSLSPESVGSHRAYAEIGE